jgi:Icc-related predicted phosphoesterase
MRILVISDLHGSQAATETLAQREVDWDLLLVAGDITDFGGGAEAARTLAPLRESGRPLACVRGNCDRRGVADYLEEAGISVDGRGLLRAGLGIAGAGGGLLHRGFTPNELSEEGLEAELRAALTQLGRPPDIILCHSPPNGTPLDRRHSSHLGSHCLREILSEAAPRLWVSGHIHESRASARLGPTNLLNPGPLVEGYYALVEWGEKEVSVELRRLTLPGSGRT